MMDFFLSLLLVLTLLLLHELGHVVCAIILKQKIKGAGITLKPYPHFYVAIDWPKEQDKKLIFLFSGFATYLTLLLLAYLNNLLAIKVVQNAFIIQALIETNPLYSDFTIAKITTDPEFKLVRNKNSYNLLYKKKYQDYLFSGPWYIHFFIWLTLIFVLTKNIAQP